MNSNVFCSILLIYCVKVEIVITVTDTDINATATLTESSYCVRKRKLRLSPIEIRKLYSLNVEVAHMVATYISPQTFRPTVLVKVLKRRRKHNKAYGISRSTKVTTKGVYFTKSHWPSHKERREIIYAYFLKVFARYDDEKMAIITNTTVDHGRRGDCYMKTYGFFMRHCYYNYYILGGIKNVRRLLAQACLADWLDADKIIRVLKSCCRERFKFLKFDEL